MSYTDDHFNYPSSCRKDLMSLSTISVKDEKMSKFKGGITTNRDYSYNLFNVDLESKINLKQKRALLKIMGYYIIKFLISIKTMI